MWNNRSKSLLWVVVTLLIAVGCGPETESGPAGDTSITDQQNSGQINASESGHQHEEEVGQLSLPELSPAELNGDRLVVVATTSIIGDVVAKVGGENIELITLMAPGQDPHSYQPAAQDLAAVSGADIIFVNGWDLEEGLINDLENIGENVPIIPVSANIMPLNIQEREVETSNDQTGYDHKGADPHVWLSIPHVKQWVRNIEKVLSTLDPAHATQFKENTAAYQAELDELETYVESQLATIDENKRFLITNHDSLGYFAEEYSFIILGTIIPGGSTTAEPSAGDLVDLLNAIEISGVCTIFSETTASNSLAQTIAEEMDDCDNVQILALYTGSLGPVGSGADSYLGMFRTNVDTIVMGLR